MGPAAYDDPYSIQPSSLVGAVGMLTKLPPSPGPCSSSETPARRWPISTSPWTRRTRPSAHRWSSLQADGPLATPHCGQLTSAPLLPERLLRRRHQRRRPLLRLHGPGQPAERPGSLRQHGHRADARPQCAAIQGVVPPAQGQRPDRSLAAGEQRGPVLRPAAACSGDRADDQ